MELVGLVRDLSDAFGVAGFEDDVRQTIERVVSPFVDEVRSDALGNLLAFRKGQGDLTLMLDAHTDEIGFIVKWIDDKGYLRFAPLGGWDARILPSHRVEILTRSGARREGVIGSTPPHIQSDDDRNRPIPIEAMFIDVGATSREEAIGMGFQIGDPLTIHPPFVELREGYVCGKALDDRAGCAVLVEAAGRLSRSRLGVNVVFAFATGEEVGARGARTAAYQVKPDVALSVEGTIGADMPGVPEESQPVRLGRGPAITVADRTIIVPRRIIQALEGVAQKNAIPYQYKLPTYGGTNAGVVHTSRGGVLAGVVSVPCRFIHSPTSTLRLDDLENTIRLVVEFVKALPGALQRGEG